MAVGSVVINFGCPRSGTTWMRKACEQMRSVFAWKLSENSALHPCHSDHGLVDLAESLHKRHLLMIRTVRHPLEVAESFAATRTEKLKSQAPGLARNTDEDVVRWIVSESEGFAAQKARLPVLEVRYDSLGEEGYREMVVDAASRFRAINGVDAHNFRRGLNTFGKMPARVGRLSEGIGSVLTPERRAWFAERLADVIEREGFA